MSPVSHASNSVDPWWSRGALGGHYERQSILAAAREDEGSYEESLNAIMELLSSDDLWKDLLKKIAAGAEGENYGLKRMCRSAAVQFRRKTDKGASGNDAEERDLEMERLQALVEKLGEQRIESDDQVRCDFLGVGGAAFFSRLLKP